MIEDHKNGKFQFTIETESIYYSTRNTDEYYFQEIVCTPQDYFHYSNFIFQKEPPVGFTEDDVLTLNGILNKSLNTIDMDLINREWIGTNTSIDATTKTLSQTLFLSNLLMISFISILISALIIYTVDKINIHKTFDTLTNLYNRSYMEFLYHNSNKISGKRLTYFDLNKFKCINDTYGHKTGDLVLKRFSNILLENFRNDEVFRLSGDEFIVISDNSYTTSEFLTRIYNIQEKLSTDFKVPGTNYILNTSASIGITDPNITVNKSLHEILELADKTMYLSKVNENITFLDKHNYSTIQSEIDLINTLNNYDFENVKTILNPLYSLKNNKIAGYESVSKLLCDGKLLKFSSFSSFIKNKRKFDMQSYRNATSNMKLVGRENQILIIYFSHNSMELLGKVLNENKSGYKIVFELNEKIELSNTDNEIMKKLSSMGYSFLISNFSGGHHSLISLKYNYIGYIKFNPSIFEKIHINSDEIANFIDNFKNHFNVEVIVENIDTKEDYELYKNANIDYIQGNYFKN